MSQKHTTHNNGKGAGKRVNRTSLLSVTTTTASSTITATAAPASAEVVVRPTEAQLRWAQFHHHRGASAVRDRIQRLWQSPANVSDVEGARSDDGNTSVSSNDSNEENNGPQQEDHNAIRRQQQPSRAMRRKWKNKNRPRISRGRRALLRVSNRAYEKRRQEILAHGFSCHAIGYDDDEDYTNQLGRDGRGKPVKLVKQQQQKLLRQVESMNSNDNETLADGLVDSILAEETAWKKKRKRSRHTTAAARRFVTAASNDEERVRRFEAAFHAMMMNLSAASQRQQHPEPVMSPTGKRWTRAVPVAVSIDGRHYDDLKWGVTFRTNSAESPTSGTGSHSMMAPMDRGATWMMHLPSKPRPQSKQTRPAVAPTLDGNDDDELYDGATPGRMKFNALVALLQQRTMVKSGRDLMERRVPKMRLRLGKDTRTVPIVAVTDKRWRKLLLETQLTNNVDTLRYPHGVVVDGRNRLVLSTQDLDSSCCDSPSSRGPTGARPAVTTTTPSAASDAETDLLFATLRGCNVATPMGDSVATDSSDVYATLRHDGNEDDANSGNNIIGRSGARLLQSNCRGSFSSSPDVGSISSSDAVSPLHGGRGGIWRSARQAAGAALHQLSVSSLGNATPTNGSASQIGRRADQRQVDIRNKPETTIFSNDIVHAQESVRSSESGESKFWNSARNSDGHHQQSPTDGKESDSERPTLDSADGLTTSSTGSDFGMWRKTRNLEEHKSPSSLPCIPERLTSLATHEAAASKENYNHHQHHSREDSESPRRYSTGKVNNENNLEDTDDTNSNASKGSDVWRILRNQAKVGGRFLNRISESKNGESCLKKSPDRVVATSISRSAARAVGSLGGVLKMIASASGKNEPLALEDAKEDELKAVAAFRKTQDERRPFDAKSGSTSSFGVLPDSIRRVVQQYGSPIVEDNGKEDVIYEANPAHDSYESDEHDDAEGFDKVQDSPSVNNLSPERVKDIHQMVMMNSVLIGDKETEHTIIDTDDTSSSASIDGYNPRTIANLMLSPALLTKRLHQAMRAIEKRNWEQVTYLLSANPWLAEMIDVTTNQFLIHKLALYGGGVCEVDPLTGEIVHVEHPPAPDQLNNDLLSMFPASVHKFDNDGNLPLHMAAASGNINMIRLLASRFPEGASVRNEEGMLPLHLIILACAAPSVSRNVKESPKEMVETLLGYFGGAVAIADNDGNLPIHCAAISLVGDVGVDVVHVLLDEADRQAAQSFGSRFVAPRSKVHVDNDSDATEETMSQTDSSHDCGDVLCCNAVQNQFGETALTAAINARAGWEMIEAIASGSGGRDAIMLCDANRNTALHLLVSDDTADPAAVVSILKLAPRAATLRNDEGMLPIEVACRQSMPREVIVALLLVDLPIDLDDRDGVKIVDGNGGSWWFLTCECDDQYVDVVEEIVSICSYQQMREMCFMKGGLMRDGGPVVSRATPKCREALLKALRFVGRFELVGNASMNAESKPGVKVFDALDFGTDNAPYIDGRRVQLYCFATQDQYLVETATLRRANLDVTFVEETFDFVVHEDDDDSSPPQQFCVAVESPIQTLNRVVAGMLDSPDYERKPELRKRYMIKVSMVLRQVAKGLCHLHSKGVVHADVCLENCGKYGDKWKLASTMGIQIIGSDCDPSRLGESAPPEAVEIEKHDKTSTTRRCAFKRNLVAQPSLDVWAFGKLAVEAIVGEPLLDFDINIEPKDDSKALTDIMQWNVQNLKEVGEDLAAVGVPKSGVALISQCLMPQAHKRPTMDSILAHPFWKEIQRLNTSNQRSGRQGRSPRKSNESR